MGTFTVTANSSTEVYAYGSWAMTTPEIQQHGDTCSDTYLKIEYCLCNSNDWATFEVGPSTSGTNTATVSRTSTSMSPDTCYTFRLRQFFTIIDNEGGLN